MIAGARTAADFIAEGARFLESARHEDAADSFAIALAHDDTLVEAWLGYGRAMLAQNRLQAALTHLEQAAALAPACVASWMELARALKQSGRSADAARAYEKAIAADPLDAAAYINLGLLCLAQLGEPKRAEDLLRRAVALAPTSVEAQVNLGMALQDQARLQEAVEHYDGLISADPGNVEYRWHRACVRLAQADFAGGWDDYEARKRRPAWSRSPPPFPEWDGERLTRGTLLLYAEQGLGDEIMFASCIPDALQRVEHCVIECDRRLAALFARSFPQAKVHGVERAREDWSWLCGYPDIAAQCATGSLPRFFRRSTEAFPAAPYLVPDPSRVAAWRALVGGDRTRKIGIAWRGGTRQTRGELRSTSLSDWLPVLGTVNARFYPLQALTDADRVESAEAVSLLQPSSAPEDLDDLAAATTVLDLVVTVQGTPVHMAGALASPVWVLLAHSAEWRYLAAGDRMPWYASARLFRQPAPRLWPPVFAAVRHALDAQC